MILGRLALRSVDSSVIFLVIIALWAAYLVPHWLRRREQLSASRSVDRFSAAMRVLARRSETPVVDRRPASRSYVLMPPREAVRDVVVKRSRPVADAEPDVRPNSRRTPVVLPLALLGLVLAAPVLAGLVLADVLATWAPVLPLLAAVAAVVALRTSAVRRRAAARPAPRRPVVRPRPAATPPGDQGLHAHPGRVASLEQPADEPGRWTPVPVPPPTYTLKDQAPPRRPAPLPEPEPQPAPAPEPAVDPVVEVDLDAVLERRRASGE